MPKGRGRLVSKLAIWRYLEHRGARGELPPGTQVAVVTDRVPTVAAQQRHSGFGGTGRGYHLAAPSRYTNGPHHKENTQIIFFHVKGIFNQADSNSRTFGIKHSTSVLPVTATAALLRLKTCSSPMRCATEGGALCEDRWCTQ